MAISKGHHRIYYFFLSTLVSRRVPKYQKNSNIFFNLIRGHCEGGPTGFSKNFKTPFFERYWKILSRGYSNRSRTSYFFKICQQIQSLEAYKVFAKLGCGWQADWAMAQIFWSNLIKHAMNKYWKLQEDTLIHIWARARSIKICCNQLTLYGYFVTLCPLVTTNF